LAWVSRLAKTYIVPYMRRLLEDKGVLYLTAYVANHAKARKIRGHQHENMENALSALVNSVTGRGWSSSDLREKLRIFKLGYPRLYRLLVDKLEEHELSASMRGEGSLPKSMLRNLLLRAKGPVCDRKD
jgi:hypothetical protein